MANQVAKYTVGDELPPLTGQLLSDGVAANCSSATAVYLCIHDPDDIKLDLVATWVDKATGLVQYQWTGGQINKPGKWTYRWVVTFPLGDESFPNEDPPLVMRVAAR